ncbi:hypothetical protein T069G_09633 [Trichoderma breve]|uniref:Zn(2)-C6 fungal-type domain-containing protein n=1 Tax=Trichoderma breve TaxID=2034170 RepID=A0A9W9E3W5_9HYPO|nr:hypothetical protein T069G_09633 [Trichoderma breve]KAJ4856265.1 hypothetical protein T069G_09633 [Trichoderma breve]
MNSLSPINTSGGMSAASSNGGSVSPRQAPSPKNVAFELLFLESPQYRARLPMRVQIYPHDTTDSIVTTVKNFYGLYSGPPGSKGVSFEDELGNTLIARYENFRNNMIVYVRVIEEAPVGALESHHYRGLHMGADSYYGGDGYALSQRYGPEMARSYSTSPRRRSPSPRGRRSDSSSTNGKKGRSRSTKSRSLHNHTDAYAESMNGYSSGDGAPSTASARAKEQLGTTDISVENIVEGGRRKRAKFESSELPLFAPPQMPAATSNPSVSPARRIEHHRPSLSYVQTGQNPFINPRPLHSPQSYGSGHGLSMYSTPVSSDRRGRGSISYGSHSMTHGMGILPTPDPTVGSCMSEEDKDVAIQLMRLGEMSNISHGRTSASTLEDAFSGRADGVSSTGATSDSDSDSDAGLPPSRRQKLDLSGVSKQIYQTTESHFMPPIDGAEASGDDADYEDGLDVKPTQSRSIKAPRASNGSKTKKPPIVPNGPISPAASTTHSRKQSVVSIGHVPQAGEDEQPDLSTKPRCQRCRKSKKGCDRQRPCGRCRDAGLSADQCISEDEGNGRKGRYGRHMGVPLKKEELIIASHPALLPAAPIAANTMTADKAKKRKR